MFCVQKQKHWPENLYYNEKFANTFYTYVITNNMPFSWTWNENKKNDKAEIT